MGITCQLKQVSPPTLDIFRQDSGLVDLLLTAQYLPNSAHWQRSSASTHEYVESMNEVLREEAQADFERHKQFEGYNWQVLKRQFLVEWEIPELDLDKSFPELTFLLAGYVSPEIDSQWTIPELKTLASRQRDREFFFFLVIENSQWDGCPLVNAIGVGTELDYETGYGPVRYLLPSEVGQVFAGLQRLSTEQFQERYRRESKKADPCPWLDWSEPEELDWLTEYFDETKTYYEDAVRNKNGMLLYLT